MPNPESEEEEVKSIKTDIMKDSIVLNSEL